MSGTYKSNMFKAAVQIRRLTDRGTSTTDPTYASAQTLLGYWEKVRARVGDGNGGFSYAIRDVCITSGQISGSASYVTPTGDDFYFDVGVDASNLNLGWKPEGGMVDTLPDVDATTAGTVHHYEITKS